MNASRRRADIAERLRVEGEASISVLATEYGTSEMTIRRDLDYLEEEGLARRARGGAIFLHSRSYEPPIHQRAGVQAEAKCQIGAAAAATVLEGETIILDVGTTTAAMAKALRHDLEVTVVTNSLLIANELASKPRVRTILTGGTVRPGEMSLVGPRAQSAFGEYHCDAVFLGIAAVSTEGLTEYNEDDAHVKRAAIASARRVVLLADATKLGRVTFAAVAPLAELDVLITDAAEDHEVVLAAHDLGVEVRCAAEPKER
ncbi:MAG TPA: DeoR/GlpR family DNA-binding transcription regulator [Acidimicrobiales bacterium]|nr:DeoR/GlpR family DNA-binding transcription regulator [Acidimicrobiales bacterium]